MKKSLKLRSIYTQTMKQPFGTYAPQKDANLLRLLTKSGLSRGKLNKWNIAQWRAKGYRKVDIVIRDIRYRLGILRNTTDAKILTSSKYYEEREIKALASTCLGSKRTDGAFIDIGANTGYYSLSLAKIGVKRILAIEPNPPTLEMLRINVALNNWNEQIAVIPSCVGEQGEVDFYQSGGLGSASIVEKDHPNSTPIRVKSAPLIQILKENNIQRVDALKIDVEGFEDQALEPFFEQENQSFWPKTLVIEHCHSESWKINILDLILSRGYTIINRTRANTVLTRSNQSR
jgi:FkbM family methyltransferase